MKHTDKHKETIKITCLYQKDGVDVQKLIKQSFQNFIKGELVKLCA